MINNLSFSDVQSLSLTCKGGMVFTLQFFIIYWTFNLVDIIQIIQKYNIIYIIYNCLLVIMVVFSKVKDYISLHSNVHYNHDQKFQYLSPSCVGISVDSKNPFLFHFLLPLLLFTFIMITSDYYKKPNPLIFLQTWLLSLFVILFHSLLFSKSLTFWTIWLATSFFSLFPSFYSKKNNDINFI